MNEQMSLFELPSEGPEFSLEEHINAPIDEDDLAYIPYEQRRSYVPLCASCVHSKKRGDWFLCRDQGPGYRILGKAVVCDLFAQKPDEEEEV